MTTQPYSEPNRDYLYGYGNMPQQGVTFDEGISPLRISYDKAVQFIMGSPISVHLFGSKNRGIEQPLTDTTEQRRGEFVLLSEYSESDPENPDSHALLALHSVQVRLFDKTLWRRKPSAIVYVDRYPDPAKVMEYMNADALLLNLTDPETEA